MPTSPIDDLKSRIASYPTEAIQYLRHGFKAAAKLSDDARKGVVDALIDAFRGGRRGLSGEALKSVTGLSTNESGQIGAAYSVTIGLVEETSASIDEFIAAARGTIFELEDEAAARTIVSAVYALRGDLSAVMGPAQLAGAVLPSFRKLDLALDLRIKFVENKLKSHVPVVIAYLDTDAQDQELWFQMTKGDVESLVKQLNEILENLKTAATLLDGK